MSSETVSQLAKTCSDLIKLQRLPQEQELLVGAEILRLLASSKNVHMPTKESIEPAPPQPKERPVKIIAHKGLSCSCSVCGKVAYQLQSNLTDPMPSEEFKMALVPVGHSTVVSEISNIEGNVAVNCPHCGGDKTVYIIGSKPAMGEDVLGSVGGPIDL